MTLSSSLTDDCLLASTWDYAGITRHATPRRRTPTPSFQHLWRKHRSTARGTSPRRHCLNTLRPACRTTSTVRFSLFTPPSAPPSSPSPSTRPGVPVDTYASPHASTPMQQSPRGVVSQPRTRRWSCHTDNVAGSSDVKSKKESTRQSDNRNHRVQLGIRCIPRTTPSAVRKNYKQSVKAGEVSAHRYLPHTCLGIFPWRFPTLI
jgi:hypothetical protein